jgi:hypothetical protein
MLRAKRRTPTPSIVFTIELTFESFKEFAVNQQGIISTTLPKVFEMHNHNGYETQTKNWTLMWKVIY